MEDIDIKSITKRCEKATKGPWIYYIEGRMNENENKDSVSADSSRKRSK